MNGAAGMRTPGRRGDVAQPSRNLPVHEERRGEEVAQEAEPRDDRREGVRLGQDVEELDLQNVAGPARP